MLRILFILCLLSTSFAEELPKEETDGHESRKILGSSVVTSVSVITNSVNGEKKPSFVNAMGQQVPKPHIASQIASPINLLNPDRYEFYTFNNDGELIKRLMTLEEIQGIIASGDTENNQFNYELNITPSSENEVSDIVENVQIVLKKEIEAQKNASKDKINLDTPDVSETWNVILPSIFGSSTGSSLHVSDLVHKSTLGTSPSPIISSTTRSEPSYPSSNFGFSSSRPTTEYKPQPQSTQRPPTTEYRPQSTRISSIIPFVVTNTSPVPTKVTFDTTKFSESTNSIQEVREKPSTTTKTTASSLITRKPPANLWSTTEGSTRKPPVTLWSTTEGSTRKPPATLWSTTEVKRYTTSPLNSMTKYTSQMVPQSTRITVGTKFPEIHTTPMTSREAENYTTYKLPESSSPVTTTLMPLNDLIKTFYSQTVMNITTEPPKNYTLIKETVTRRPEIKTTTKYTTNKISEANLVTLKVTPTTNPNKPEVLPTTVQFERPTVFRPEKITITSKFQTTPLPTTIKDPEIMNSIKDIATTFWQEMYSNTERNKQPSEPVNDFEDKYVNDDDRLTTEFSVTKNAEMSTMDQETFEFLNGLEPTTGLPTTWFFNAQNEFSVSGTTPKETVKPFLNNRFGITKPIYYSSSLPIEEKKTTAKIDLSSERPTNQDEIKPIYNRYTSLKPLEESSKTTTFTVQTTKPSLTTKYEVEDSIKPIYNRITTIKPIEELRPMSEFLVSSPPNEVQNVTEPNLDELEQTKENFKNNQVPTKAPRPTDVPKESIKTTPKPTDVPKENIRTTTKTPKPTDVPTESTKRPKPTDVPKENIKVTAKPTELPKENIKITTKTPKPTDVPKESIKTTSKTPKPTDVPKENIRTTTKTPAEAPKESIKSTSKTPKPTDLPKENIRITTKTPKPMTDVPTESTKKPKPTDLPTTKPPKPTEVSKENVKLTTNKMAVTIISTVSPKNESTSLKGLPTTVSTTKMTESSTSMTPTTEGVKKTTTEVVREKITRPTLTTLLTTKTNEVVSSQPSPSTTTKIRNSSSTVETSTTEKITTTIGPVGNSSVPYRKTEDTWKLVATVIPPTMTASTKAPTPPDVPIEYYQQPTKIDLTSQGNFGVQTLSEDMQTFSKLYNELALKFWSSLSADHISPERSVVVSPFGAISTLSMIFLGARGSTSGEMNDLLKLDDIVTFNPHLKFKEVTESVTSRRSSAIVRELYSDNTKGKILDFYKERVKQFYDGHVEEIDFKVVNDVLRRRTNLMIRKQTRGQMKQYLGDTNFVLKGPLAALSMNIFQSECRTASTKGRDGEIYFIVLPSMRQRRLVPIPAAVWRSDFIAGYDPELDATAVSIGSTNQVISTIFVMPGQQGHSAPGDVLLRLEARLLDTTYMPQTWAQLLRSMLPRANLEVQIPRFSHKSIINITNSLKKMGLKEMFDSKRADLRGLTGSKHNLYFSDILQVNEFTNCGETQQLHMEMYPSYNETDYQMEQLRSYRYFEEQRRRYTHIPLPLRPRQARLPEVARLRFDRPFLYFVRHNPTGLILHMGRFNPKLLP